MRKLSLLLLTGCVLAPTEPHSPLFVPARVPLGGAVSIYLCEPYEYGTKLMIDEKTLLGTMGQDLTTGCMKLYYPGFNVAGLRTISVKNYTSQIEIFDFFTR
jgi:hypothetical protein